MPPIIKGGEMSILRRKVVVDIEGGDIDVYQKVHRRRCCCFAHLVLKKLGRSRYISWLAIKREEIVFPQKVIGVVPGGNSS